MLRVSALPAERWRGRLLAGTWVIPCVLGPAGITHAKREGDGATPAGQFRLERFLFRKDRGARPGSRLPGRTVSLHDGWCDDPMAARYNQPVAIPFARRHEALWRDDRLYDLLVVIDHNRSPVRKQRGSAIFLHVRPPQPKPTAGCVAVDLASLRKLIARVDRKTRLVIG